MSRTILEPIAGQGVGLFSARRVRFAIRPAEPGAGVTFRRVDLEGAPPIPATIEHLDLTPIHPAFAQLPPRNTTLALDADNRVITTEHVLGALAGLGITDARIELDAPELPIFDGSARQFSELLRLIGFADTPARIDPIVLTEPISVSQGQASITAEPIDGGARASYTYFLDYGPHPAISPQSASWDAGAPDAAEVFAAEIAPARTFCLQEEAQQLHAAGLFTHLSPTEMLVLGPMGPIDNELRFDDEPARHKLLDLVGDLALLGRPLLARVTAHRSGHALTHELCRAIRDRHPAD